ncbi:MAG: HAMP domain-containing sensor histidine kinase [Pseudomonadota bacterium]
MLNQRRIGQARPRLIATQSAEIAKHSAVRRAANQSAANAKRDAQARIEEARLGLLRMMHHELRTPLNAIVGFSEMLAKPAVYKISDEQRASYAAFILESADAVRAGVDALLRAVEASAGALSPECQMADLNAILKAAVDEVATASELAGVAVVIKPPTTELEASVDADALREALALILRNAIENSDPGSRVLARVAEDFDGALEIAVRDFGLGYSEEEAKAALDAISFGAPAPARGGLKLSIAKALIQLQGGVLTLSAKPGHGALVRLVLGRE